MSSTRNSGYSVVCEDSSILKADKVVYNGDPRLLHRFLLPHIKNKPLTQFRLNRFESSMGLMVIYFSTKRRYESVPHHLIFMGSQFEEHLDGVFRKGRLVETPNVYLHRPTATDPQMAPDGCDSFYVLVPVPNCTSPINWAEEGPRYADRIMDLLEKHCLPELRSSLDDFHVRTPLDFEQSQLCLDGSAFTITPRLTQSAFFRFPHRIKEARDIYCVGAGTHPGAGIPGVLSSAKALEEVLL